MAQILSQDEIDALLQGLDDDQQETQAEAPQQENSQSVYVNLPLLLDIPLQVTVELGRARMTINNILRLTPGAVVELNRRAGEPLDIYANSKLIARGEAVAVRNKLGVRILSVEPQNKNAVAGDADNTIVGKEISYGEDNPKRD